MFDNNTMAGSSGGRRDHQDVGSRAQAGYVERFAMRSTSDVQALGPYHTTGRIQ